MSTRQPAVIPPYTAQCAWSEAVAAFPKPTSETYVRRREPRIDQEYSSAKLIFVRPDKGDEVERMCTLLDISDNGMMVRARTEIRPPAVVRIEAYVDDAIYHLRGKIMHCTSSIGAYKVGILLDFDTD